MDDYDYDEYDDDVVVVDYHDWNEDYVAAVVVVKDFFHLDYYYCLKNHKNPVVVAVVDGESMLL